MDEVSHTHSVLCGIGVGQYPDSKVRYVSSDLADLCASKASVRSPLESRDTLLLVFTECPKEGGGAKAIRADSRLPK